MKILSISRLSLIHIICLIFFSAMYFLGPNNGGKNLLSLLLLMLCILICCTAKNHEGKEKLGIYELLCWVLFFISYAFSSIYLLWAPDILKNIALKKAEIISKYDFLHTYLIFVAFSILYFGYRSGIYLNCFSCAGGQKLKKLNLNVFLCLFAISIISTLILIYLNIYGFNSSVVNVKQYQGIMEPLYVLSSFGKLAIIILLWEYLNEKKYLLLLITAVLLNVSIGFVSLYKSEVVTPLLIVALMLYRVGNKFWLTFFAVALILLLASHVIIDGKRAEKISEGGSKPVLSASQQDITRSSASVDIKQDAILALNKLSVGVVNLMDRLNLEFIGSLAIRYREMGLKNNEPTPDFLGDIFWSPVYAIIPRVVWRDKPALSYGNWYTGAFTDYKNSEKHSVSIAIGPVAAAFLAGGWPLVVCLFYFVGIICGWLSKISVNLENPSCILGYFIALKYLVFLGDGIPSILVNLVRAFVFWFILDALLYRGALINIFERTFRKKITHLNS